MLIFLFSYYTVMKVSRIFVGILIGLGLGVTFMYVMYQYSFWFVHTDDFLDGIIMNWSGDLKIQDTADALQEVYDLLQTHYYDTWSINQTTMSRQAIASFVNALGDPFSSYLEPLEDKNLVDSLNGTQTIEGIGAMLSQKEVGVMVEEVIKSSPASQADIQPLDIIVKVGWSEIHGESLADVVSKIRGPRWTTVDLTILRIVDGTPQMIFKTVTRDTVIVPSVSSKVILDKKWRPLGYLSLAVFGEDTNIRLIEAMKDFHNQNISWLILDVRGNWGGLLPEAVTVASHFLPQSTSVVQAKYRVYQDQIYYTEWLYDIQVPLVILVDGLSASASEIITAAIKEWRCALLSWSQLSGDLYSGSTLSFDDQCDVQIVGTKTFGKWSVQELHPMNFWWSVKLTVGKWFTPHGYSVDGSGITPDEVIEFDREMYTKSSLDNQLQKAIAILSQK